MIKMEENRKDDGYDYATRKFKPIMIFDAVTDGDDGWCYCL